MHTVMELTSNAIRGAIIAPHGRKLCIADLSNIEGRGLAVLAGETWKIKAFAEFDASLIVDVNGKPILNAKGERQFSKPDLYKLAYARSFNVKPESVNKDQRQIGKVQELGLGYEGGVAAFLTFAAVYDMDLEELANAVWATASREALTDAGDMLAWVKKKRRSTFGLSDKVYIACEVLKASWRAAHPATTALWKNVGEAVRNAIQEPGATFTVRDLKIRRDGAWLRIRLPSGRYLCYTQPQANDGQISYAGVNQYTRQWGRIKTYGGKITENITQAWARDVLAANMPAVETEGYQIVLTVHDELLTETPDTDDFSHQRLAELMATPPAWAPGTPLAAAGFECYRYRKD